MSKLSSISSSPTLRTFAQGAAQSAIQPVADFLAPGVDVATLTGKYKSYSEKNRFKIPNTLRGVGGKATILAFDATDSTYDCQPHALDFPVDNLEQLEAGELENRLKEGATAIAEVAALAHERDVLNKALSVLGAGTDSNFTSSSVDPVDVIDEQILAVIKAAKYGSLMGVGVLFGATAFRRFKNNANVQKRFRQGGSLVKEPTTQNIGEIFIGNPEVRTSLMVQDTAAEGVAESINFLLDAKVIVFARMANPTRRDPSFMKTFRLMGQWMVPGSYVREDGRGEVAKFDWSEDVEVTNTAAGKLINANNA